MADTTEFQTNLRRMILFDYGSNREAAKALGVTERTISQWLTGKRYPSGQGMMAIHKTFEIAPRDLDLDPIAFAQKLADPVRMQAVIDSAHAARARQIQAKQRNKVTDIADARKK